MRKLMIVVLMLAITAITFAKKNQKYEKAPKGMVFCPKGSFDTQRINASDTSSMRITLRSFWVGNEITNKEFRAFYNYLNQNKEKSIEWTAFIKMKDGSTTTKLSRFPCEELLSDHINTKGLKGESGKENYFFDAEFNDFPVVGISKTAAEMYCIWKTNSENTQLIQKGRPHIMPYRLPTAAEWDYMQTFGVSKRQKTITDDLHIVKKGILSNLGIYNITGNVSEWVLTTKSIDSKKQAIAKGSSYQNNDDQEIYTSQQTQNKYIGFRIVRDYIGD